MKTNSYRAGRFTQFINFFFFIFQTEVDVIEDIEKYQTIPGGITLCLRILVMICFVIALRETMMHEYNPDKLGMVSEKISLITIFGHISLFLFELNCLSFSRDLFLK